MCFLVWDLPYLAARNGEIGRKLQLAICIGPFYVHHITTSFFSKLYTECVQRNWLLPYRFLRRDQSDIFTWVSVALSERLMAGGPPSAHVVTVRV